MALYPAANQATPPRAGLLRRAYNAAKSKLLPESRTQPKIRPRVVIMHSAAGRGSLYNFFLRSSNLESHFWVSEAGVVEQYIDTNVRADANNKANGFAISIETESTRSATEPWNPVQFAAIVKLVRWCCDTHGIPAVICPRWDGAGIGWHIQFGAPGPWTPVSKSCPGPARIRQMPYLVAQVAAPVKPADPNAGRPYRTFAAPTTDATIYRAGGRNNQISEAQMLFGIKPTGRYTTGDALSKAVVNLKAKARWVDASGTPDRSSRITERFIRAVRALAAS